ncbi:Kelch repeat-containing protein [Miltoncostaea marina]|uniref:Kelch repeat-containing protein n=1 Tax=Miltoncostaea marina TaxID=2843215 RepID=UPI001C3C8B82|nr:kelch repeat-containing protein [Miltoncostaea marina]
MRYRIVALAALLAATGCSDAGPAWRHLEAAPEARTEVAGALLSGGRVAVVGGLTADGAPSPRVDVYDTRRRRWTRLPDLPEPLHHAMAVGRQGRLYVVGGYRARDGEPSDRAWVLFDRRWRPLPPMPRPRAAGGAALVRNRVYVVGGVGPGGLARRSLHLDLRTLRWTAFDGVTPPREHLGVTAAGGRVYAIGGRTAGLGTNVAVAEAYDPVRRAWTRLPDAPTARGGGAAAAVARTVVALGGERPSGTIAAIDAFDPSARRWRSLPPSPRPRHGAAAVGVGRTVYQALGGPGPGLTASPTLMALRVARR